MRIKTSDELQGPNLMISRHGASANLLQKCAQCAHLHSCHEFGDTADFWVCEKLTTPSGHNMPWSETNGACGLFEERE
uniref:Uncharacterized protein n=1 Tax=viral metagenome TaxID=1070528 RepID=A0A6M3J9H4_9ZZZZ